MAGKFRPFGPACFRRSEKAAGRTRGAVRVIVGVVNRGARFLYVRARVRALFLEERRKGEDQLRHGEEENRRTPEDSWKNTGLGHEGHTLESLVRSGASNNSVDPWSEAEVVRGEVTDEALGWRPLADL